MKASFFRRFGGPEVLEYGDLPDPVCGAGEVVVDIHAASVNAADWKMRAGQYSHGIEFPHVPGSDNPTRQRELARSIAAAAKAKGCDAVISGNGA